MEFASKNMELSDKLNYIMESYNTLGARSVVKTWSDLAFLLGINRACLSAAKQGDEKYLTDSLIYKFQGILDRLIIQGNLDNYVTKLQKKIRAWSHTPGSCQIFIQTLCSGKNRGSVTKLAIILHPQNTDGSIHPQPVQP